MISESKILERRINRGNLEVNSISVKSFYTVSVLWWAWALRVESRMRTVWSAREVPVPSFNALWEFGNSETLGMVI